MNAAHTTSSRRQTALLMALYTFLLAIGAALPIAASYGHEVCATTRSVGEIQVGGAQRREDAQDATDEARQNERPQHGPVACSDEPSSLGLDLTSRDEAGCPVAPTDSRGS